MIEKPMSKRILPRKGKGNKAVKVTRSQISDALKAFETRGGLIHKLPAEVNQRHALVGHRWDSIYEMPIERF